MWGINQKLWHLFIFLIKGWHLTRLQNFPVKGVLFCNHESFPLERFAVFGTSPFSQKE